MENWINVKDKMPLTENIGKEYIIATKDGHVTVAEFTKLHTLDYSEVWYGFAYGDGKQVIAYMEMPKAPNFD